MIKSSHLKEVCLMEFFTIVNNVKDYASQENLESLKLKNFFDEEFLPTFNLFNDTLKVFTKTGLTEEITKIDNLRDNDIVRLNAHIRVYEHFPEKSVAEAATRLRNIIDKYGKNIQTLPLAEETGVILNLLEDFNEAKAIEDLTLINAKIWADQLAAHNIELNRLFKERISIEGAKEAGKSKETREKMQKIFTDFCNRINALALLEDKTPYQRLADNINREVERAKQLVKQRKTDKENTQILPEGQNPPTENPKTTSEE